MLLTSSSSCAGASFEVRATPPLLPRPRGWSGTLLEREDSIAKLTDCPGSTTSNDQAVLHQAMSRIEQVAQMLEARSREPGASPERVLGRGDDASESSLIAAESTALMVSSELQAALSGALGQQSPHPGSTSLRGSPRPWGLDVR
ncbi:unnamed protein product [Effrenium voratum]|nr:unnamed protein product [Effrenium voratum]